ncbi:MAG: type II CRISPR RNA-guided endonuclease Cas9, partial [Alphaproteobacteria bacterium]|nr:type II CRISPR RNA-guided endonuclease Cas9 [Alphaproteobacteria bacterium]
MSYKLALDLGSTSIGWAILALEGESASGLQAMGVRVYDDGREAKSKEPTAVARRLARAARRGRDRKKGRVNRLRVRLAELGLFPTDREAQKRLECKDPYDLRARALDEKLDLHDIGRALMHLAQRRGFKSNRKSDKGSNEAGPVKEAAAKLEQQIIAAGARSLGEYLNGCDVKRVRRHADGAYSIYPFRQMYEEEFNKIIEAQRQYYPDELHKDIVTTLHDIIFFQRDLHKPKVGYCSFEYEIGALRAALALPMVQEFRVYQEVANLDFERYSHDDPHLTPKQKQKIAALLNRKAKVTFKAMRKELGISGSQTFNLESDARADLKGNDTAAKLANKKAFGNRWFDLDVMEQTDIVFKLLNEESERQLQDWLVSQYGLTTDQAEHIANINLADGYGRLSLVAIEKILPFLKQGMKYSDA